MTRGDAKDMASGHSAGSYRMAAGYQYGTAVRKQAPSVSPRQPQLARGGRSQAQALQPGLVVKVAACVAVVVFAAAVARVWLTTGAVEHLIAAEEVAEQVTTARALGNELEIEQATLANTTRIQREASALGMQVATDVTYIDLAAGALATDSSGALSLSGSIDVLAAGAVADAAAADAAALEAAQAAEAEAAAAAAVASGTDTPPSSLAAALAAAAAAACEPAAPEATSTAPDVIAAE